MQTRSQTKTDDLDFAKDFINADNTHLEHLRFLMGKLTNPSMTSQYKIKLAACYCINYWTNLDDIDVFHTLNYSSVDIWTQFHFFSRSMD